MEENRFIMGFGWGRNPLRWFWDEKLSGVVKELLMEEELTPSRPKQVKTPRAPRLRHHLVRHNDRLRFLGVCRTCMACTTCTFSLDLHYESSAYTSSSGRRLIRAVTGTSALVFRVDSARSGARLTDWPGRLNL